MVGVVTSQVVQVVQVIQVIKVVQVVEVVRMIRLDDMHSENIWFSGSKPSMPMIGLGSDKKKKILL